LYRVESLFN